MPTSVTAFPISSSFVDALTPSLVIEVKDNEQVISLLGLSNVMMRFSGKIKYKVEAPGGYTFNGSLDLSHMLKVTNPTTGVTEFITLPEASLPVAALGLGVDFFPPGSYKFSYSVSIWPIQGNQASIDEVWLIEKQLLKYSLLSQRPRWGTVSDHIPPVGKGS